MSQLWSRWYATTHVVVRQVSDRMWQMSHTSWRRSKVLWKPQPMLVKRGKHHFNMASDSRHTWWLSFLGQCVYCLCTHLERRLSKEAKLPSTNKTHKGRAVNNNSITLDWNGRKEKTGKETNLDSSFLESERFSRNQTLFFIQVTDCTFSVIAL